MSLSSKLGILSLMGRPTKTPSFQSVINSSGPSPVGCRLRTATLLPSTLHPFIHVLILISQLASSSITIVLCQSQPFQHLTPFNVLAPFHHHDVCPLSIPSQWGVWSLYRAVSLVFMASVVWWPWAPASGQLRLVTSSWRQARLSTAHIYYPP